MITQNSPHIEKAVGVLKELSHDERIRLLYEAREKARRDEEARIEGAVEQRSIKIVKNFLKKYTYRCNSRVYRIIISRNRKITIKNKKINTTA